MLIPQLGTEGPRGQDPGLFQEEAFTTQGKWDLGLSGLRKTKQVYDNKVSTLFVLSFKMACQTSPGGWGGVLGSWFCALS